MRYSTNAIIFILIFLLLLCSSNTVETENNDLDEGNLVRIRSNIDKVTTWSGDSIYVIEKFDFYVNNTLLIQPGTIVKFHSTKGPYLMLGGTGTIIAKGIDTLPIIFTSYKDDQSGGDTNGDGGVTAPAKKDWGHINTNGLHGSIFQNCYFFYGGNSTYNATLTLYGDNITIDNCLFVNNDGSYTSSAGDIGVLDATNGGAQTVITNNIFYHNVRPLSISTQFSLDSSNVFHNPDTLTQKNTHNGIFVESSDEITSTISWLETEIAYVVDDNDFYIQGINTLTLADNVVIKFKPASALILDNGISNLVNFSGAGVFYTSYKDDTQKGDTNGDGPITSAAPNDWVGIYDNSMAIPSPFYYQWSNIVYDSH